MSEINKFPRNMGAKKLLVENFCNGLEKICKDFSIEISKISSSVRSESKYYTLKRGNKHCSLRVSCHPQDQRINFQTSATFNIFLTEDTDMTIEIEKLMTFFHLKKL